jgi:hypothetical protein
MEALNAADQPISKPHCGEDTAILTWRIHPLRDDPRGIAGVAAAYALSFVLWRFLFPHPLGLILPVVGLTGALSDYLFPTTFRLTKSGAHSDCGLSRLTIAWTDVRRATQGADGIHLSPFSRATRLNQFRGVRLRFAGGVAPEQIVETVRELRDGSTKA